MSYPDRRSPALVRSGGPLGALPALSGAARRALAGIAVLAALTAVSVVAQALSLAQLVSAVVAGHAWSSGWLAVLAAAVVARAVLTWATQVVAARAAAGTKAELRASLVDSAVRRGPEWIATRGPAELTALGTRGLDALDAYFAQYLPALVSAAVLPLAVGAAILLADPLSAVLVAVTVPLIPLFAILVGKYTQSRVGELADAEERLSGRLLELIKALPVLIAFRRANAQVTAVRKVSEKHRAATMATLRVAFSSAVVLELVATLSVALVAVGIGLRLVGGDLTLATGLFVLVLAPECYLPLRAAGAAHHASEDGVEAVRRVADLLVEPTADGEEMPRGEVRLESLTVQRRDSNPLTCTIRPGEITRLDLPSGAGKSTAIAALLGFATPSAGRITVGGADLATADLTAWRRAVAWVPQRPAFTGARVDDELRMAVPEALTSDITELSVALGINDLLGRGTAELSTGERQRVAVARALLRVRHGAWLLVLDEPTAHLDAAHAAAVQAQVERAAAEGVAVLLASHRATAPGEGPARTGAPNGAVRSAREPGRARLRTVVTARLLLAAALGTLALAAGVALTATSAWLIATASQHPPILTLSVAIVGVRAFGLAKAGLRYAERLTSHDAALRTATELRERLWRKVISLGAAAPHPAEAARRLVDDVTTVRDLTPRVLMPPLIAVGVSALAVAVQWTVQPAAGATLLAAVFVAVLLAPWLTVRLDRKATAALTDDRRAVAARLLSLLDAAPDLLAYGADASVRKELADLDADLTKRARRQAFGAGAGAGVIVLATGLAALTGAWLGADAGVLVAVLALVPLALTEALAPVPTAAQHLTALRNALTSTTLPTHPDTQPATTARQPRATRQRFDPTDNAGVVPVVPARSTDAVESSVCVEAAAARPPRVTRHPADPTDNADVPSAVPDSARPARDPVGIRLAETDTDASTGPIDPPTTIRQPRAARQRVAPTDAGSGSADCDSVRSTDAAESTVRVEVAAARQPQAARRPLDSSDGAGVAPAAPARSTDVIEPVMCPEATASQVRSTPQRTDSTDDTGLASVDWDTAQSTDAIESATRVESAVLAKAADWQPRSTRQRVDSADDVGFASADWDPATSTDVIESATRVEATASRPPRATRRPDDSSDDAGVAPAAPATSTDAAESAVARQPRATRRPVDSPHDAGVAPAAAARSTDVMESAVCVEGQPRATRRPADVVPDPTRPARALELAGARLAATDGDSSREAVDSATAVGQIVDVPTDPAPGAATSRPPGPTDQPLRQRATATRHPGDIELTGVDVRWPGADRPAIRDLTLTIPHGAHVAIVGASGAGKSTLLALLLGFLEPERGTLRRPGRVTWCPQEPHLVATTVRENLRLADPDATDADLADALRAACLPGWVDRLDVELGAGGTGTSGGEATRLALARALLARDADLVLLDEPTAHLDVPTATALLAGLAERFAGRTVLHVTHRPEEAAAADVVLDLSARS